MYCGQCGKKIVDSMLFCPFCGSPIVIPDQDEAPSPTAARPQEPETAQRNARHQETDAPAAMTARPQEAEAAQRDARSQETDAPAAMAARPQEAEAAQRNARHQETEAPAAMAARPQEAEATQRNARSQETDAPAAMAAHPREAEAAQWNARPQKIAAAQRVAPFAPESPVATVEKRGTEATAPFVTEPVRVDRPVSLFDSPVPGKAPLRDEEFIPLSFEEASPEVAQPSKDIDIVSARIGIEDVKPEPAASRRPAPQELYRPESARRRASQTFIPVKDVDPEDMFMDGGEDADDYDDYDLDEDDGRYREDFDFEEPENGGFIQRHIRGVVGLALLLILLVICVVWAFSLNGQRTLAKANLAWTAQPYADLGYEAYRQDSDLLAARYYEKALARDESNYEYAHSAMVAYYEAEDIPSAAAMLKKCIAMNPDSPEPYQEMLILYPDAQTRPWEIQELIRQGYARTGNAALKQD